MELKEWRFESEFLFFNSFDVASSQMQQLQLSLANARKATEDLKELTRRQHSLRLQMIGGKLLEGEEATQLLSEQDRELLLAFFKLEAIVGGGKGPESPRMLFAAKKEPQKAASAPTAGAADVQVQSLKLDVVRLQNELSQTSSELREVKGSLEAQTMARKEADRMVKVEKERGLFLDKRVSELEKELRIVHESSGKVAEEKRKVTVLESEIADFEREVADLTGKNGQLKAAVEESKKARDADQKRERETAAKESNDRASLQEQHKKNEDLRASVSVLEKRVQAYEKDELAHKQKLLQEKQKTAAAEQAVADLTRKLEETQAEQQRVREESDSRESALLGEQQQKQQQIHELETVVASLRAVNNTLTKAVGEEKQEKAKRTAALEEANNRIQALHTEVEESKKKSAASADAVVLLEQKARADKEERAQDAAKIDELQNMVKSLKSVNNTLMSAVSDARLKEKKDSVTDASKLADLEADLQDAKEESAAVKAQLAAALASNTKVNQEKEELNKKIAKLSATVKDLLKHSNVQAAELKAERSRLSSPLGQSAPTSPRTPGHLSLDSSTSRSALDSSASRSVLVDESPSSQLSDVIKQLADTNEKLEEERKKSATLQQTNKILLTRLNEVNKQKK